jgi:hypothetical protein
MDVTCQFVADANYFRTTVERYNRQRPVALWFSVQYGLLAVPLFAAWLYAWRSGQDWAFAVGFLLLLWPLITLGLGQLTKGGIVRRFKSNADFNADVAIVLCDDGIESRGRHSQTKTEWGAYPSAVRYSDGILLVKPGTIRWLPDTAIRSGTSRDATLLVGAKTKLRSVAGGGDGA